jgi:hypothetical protein
MVSEVPFVIPQELKDRLRERLKSSSAFKEIAWKIKVGMGAAIGELRGQKGRKSIFDETEFPSNATDEESVLEFERQALQTVYSYLTEHDLTWTLGCLEKETRVAREREAYDLLQLLEEPEEEDGADLEEEEEDNE